jgi:uracil-DNA glycosylase family 4
MADWDSLNRRIIRCRSCPRLCAYCRQIAREKRPAFASWNYWGMPVPNFGDPHGRLLVVGLAPAAHGANRTGRMFTGDRSGEWLYRALYKAGFANQPASSYKNDGLVLIGCVVTAAIHCAPPANRPAREELANCQRWLQETVNLMPVRVFVALGRIAWNAIVDEARRRGWYQGPRPPFGHGLTVQLGGGTWLVGSYHPSQQNTFTGRLTEAMLDAVFLKAKKLLAKAGP